MPTSSTRAWPTSALAAVAWKCSSMRPPTWTPDTSLSHAADILRMLGKVAGKTTGYVLIGVEFQDITPFVRELIAGHVSSALARE